MRAIGCWLDQVDAALVRITRFDLGEELHSAETELMLWMPPVWQALSSIF
jgi:hypothetical protein